MARAIQSSRDDRIFYAINAALLTLLLLLVLYPLAFVVSASFSNTSSLANNQVWLLPVKANLTSYRAVFRDNKIWIGYRNTAVYTVLGTLINLFLTLITAYPLSRKDLKGRDAIMMAYTFTMFFSGGMIPTYLMVKNLGMINTLWALIIPGAISVTNLIITRTFFANTIPYELQESALIDGCSNVRILWEIVLPLSIPIVAVMSIYYGVAHWNAYFNALIYLTDSKKWPLQLVLRDILLSNAVTDMTDSSMYTPDQILLYEGMKYAIVVVASLPVMCLYPLLQRYFVKGVMIGAIKG
ncbi:MAG TPA: carbohydrate ABC transporter permease [Clostridia bacterium]|nr:carbohydrate ABC transporter permease [Clostridia bacterium]